MLRRDKAVRGRRVSKVSRDSDAGAGSSYWVGTFGEIAQGRVREATNSGNRCVVCSSVT